MIEPVGIIGEIATPRHTAVRYRIGMDSGDVFVADGDYEGMTLVLEVADLADARAMLAAISSPSPAPQVMGSSIEPDFAASIKRTCSEEASNGAACGWTPCTGCYDTEDGHPTAHYPHSRIFGCDVGSGCLECGGLGVVFQYWSPKELAQMQNDCISETPTAPQVMGIDCYTGRPIGDHGTGEQAVEWALHRADFDTRCHPESFLKAWQEGDAFDEWPEYYEWLASKEKEAPATQSMGADDHPRYTTARLQLEIRKAKNAGLEEAAASHAHVVTKIRNDQKSYKNGKLLKSAKRAIDFHERSALAIRAMKEAER